MSERLNTRVLTCIRCPRGCQVSVVLGDDGSVAAVSGNSCKRGEAYAKAEVVLPLRTVTTTVAVEGGAGRMPVSVKTVPEVPKGAVLDVMAEAMTVVAHAPVSIGDVLRRNVAGTGSDLVATKAAR